MEKVFLLLLCYGAGIVPVGLITGYLWTGRDIRDYGNGGHGTSNVLKTIGFEAALFNIAIEFCRGLIPGGLLILFNVSEAIVPWASITLLVGILFPISITPKSKISIGALVGLVFGSIPAIFGSVLAITISSLILFRKATYTWWIVVIAIPILSLISISIWSQLFYAFVLSSLVLLKEILDLREWPILSKDGFTYIIRRCNQ